MSIALHACCGPCLIEPLEAFAACEDVVVVFANPNIAPAEEYERRRDTLLSYARQVGARVVELPYAPDLWRASVAGLEPDRQARCRECYRLRLRLTAGWAVANGIDKLATTLTVSPYQDPLSISSVGRTVAEESGLVYLDRDFRDRYPAASVRARELGLYRQNYCGCLYSQEEADADRARRRADREAARREKASAAGRSGKPNG